MRGIASFLFILYLIFFYVSEDKQFCDEVVKKWQGAEFVPLTKTKYSSI